MINQTLKFFLVLILSCSMLSTASAQSHSSVGIAYGFNKPFSGDYKFGTGWQVQGNIALNNKWGISPSVGYERVNSKGRFYDDGFKSYRVTGIDLMHLSLLAKYYVAPNLFAKAGPMFYIAGGNDDLAGLGFGGSASIGYNLDVTKHGTFEVSLNTDVINVAYSGNGITPIASLKLAYLLNFKAHYNKGP